MSRDTSSIVVRSMWACISCKIVTLGHNATIGNNEWRSLPTAWPYTVVICDDFRNLSSSIHWSIVISSRVGGVNSWMPLVVEVGKIWNTHGLLGRNISSDDFLFPQIQDPKHHDSLNLRRRSAFQEPSSHQLGQRSNPRLHSAEHHPPILLQSNRNLQRCYIWQLLNNSNTLQETWIPVAICFHWDASTLRAVRSPMRYFPNIQTLLLSQRHSLNGYDKRRYNSKFAPRKNHFPVMNDKIAIYIGGNLRVEIAAAFGW